MDDPDRIIHALGKHSLLTHKDWLLGHSGANLHVGKRDQALCSLGAQLVAATLHFLGGVLFTHAVVVICYAHITVRYERFLLAHEDQLLWCVYSFDPWPVLGGGTSSVQEVRHRGLHVQLSLPWVL